ncbi:MAG: sigma 54-interacting transcriptional regulator [Balneolaceae bacterium]|nr:sigma 54-interacting transcriptional regulator [Balneolaceae bacterium]
MSISRIGSSKLKKTDVRVIAATNKDLWEHVQEGDFREDLYYRLDTVKINVAAPSRTHRRYYPHFPKVCNRVFC